MALPSEPPAHIVGAGTEEQRLWAQLLRESREATGHGDSIPAWVIRLAEGREVVPRGQSTVANAPDVIVPVPGDEVRGVAAPAVGPGDRDLQLDAQRDAQQPPLPASQATSRDEPRQHRVYGKSLHDDLRREYESALGQAFLLAQQMGAEDIAGACAQVNDQDHDSTGYRQRVEALARTLLERANVRGVHTDQYVELRGIASGDPGVRPAAMRASATAFRSSYREDEDA